MRKRRELRQLQIDGTYTVEAFKDLQPGWGGARKGAGRKPGNVVTRTVSIRIPVYKEVQIRARCEPEGYSLTEYIRELVLQDEGRSAQKWREEENLLVNMEI